MGQVKRLLLTALLAWIVVFSFTITIERSQAATEAEAVAPIDLIVYIGNTKMEGDTPPHMYKNTTYVSVRDFAKSTDGLLYWNPENQQVTIRYDHRMVVHVMGSKTMQVDGRTFQMGAASRIYNGRTFLPLRDMVQAIDGSITYWNEVKRSTVQIMLPQQTINNDEEKKIDRYLRQQGFVGSALVARNGQVILAQGYGPNGYGQLNSPTQPTRIASISKQFTSAAVLKLADEGKLDLRDPLSKYIPDFPKGHQITVQMLLSHYSGLPSDFPRHRGDSLQETIERIKKQEFSHAPGMKYKYSNPGYVVLAEVIQKASGMSYANYLQQAIFTPMGMRATGEASTKSATVKGFRVDNGRYTEAPDYVSQSGTGSLYSTVYDLLKWDQVMYTNRYLKPQVINQLFPPGPKVHFTVGGGNGYSTILVREPESKVTVILLSNLDRVDIHNLYLGVRKQLDD